MAMSGPNIRLSTDMSLTDIHQEISRLGKITDAPNTDTQLDGNGNEVLYVRKPSMTDKLKRLVMSAEMREVNQERLMALIDLVSRRAGIDPSDQALADVRQALSTGNGAFLDALNTLASRERMGKYVSSNGQYLF